MRAAVDAGNERQVCAAQLRQTLDALFPPTYLELYHRPPHSVCSIFNMRPATLGRAEDSGDSPASSSPPPGVSFVASSEPSGRGQVLNLKRQLEISLTSHKAKPVGLCPVRRAIYDQLFDELIRQVTVACVEQGKLLFRVRNELRSTLAYYRRAYESAVTYGLRKSLEATLELASRGHQDDGHASERQATRPSGRPERELEEATDRMRAYFECELARRDEVIVQQRAVIQALGAGRE